MKQQSESYTSQTTSQINVSWFYSLQGWFWSVGRHPEFKYDARVWRRLPGIKPGTVGPKVEIYIGIGDSLEEAVQDCKRKFNNKGTLN